MSAQSAYLYYAPQCPNCQRFVGVLNTTPEADRAVTRIDVNRLHPQQQSRISAVPTLALPSGGMLVGEKAFEWLKQFESTPESYMSGCGLAFSSVDDSMSLQSFSTPYSSINSNASWHA